MVSPVEFRGKSGYSMVCRDLEPLLSLGNERQRLPLRGSRRHCSHLSPRNWAVAFGTRHAHLANYTDHVSRNIQINPLNHSKFVFEGVLSPSLFATRARTIKRHTVEYSKTLSISAMTRSTLYDRLPPFPEDISTAPIAHASFTKLLAGDEAEQHKVLTACRTHGFFYLDLRGCPDGEALINESEGLRELAVHAFKLPIEEKMKYLQIKGVSLFGYKEPGTIKKTDKDLRPDTTEFFNVAKDHMHNVAPSRDYPEVLLSERPLLKDFTKDAHACGMIVLESLAKQLELEPNAFADLNLFNHPSGDHCRLTKKNPRASDSKAIGLPSHTDFGSVTILFTWLGGLQIQSHDPEKLGEWEYVKPLPGHAIINLGDAMVKFTNGELKSAKHRVVPAPGDQVNFDRYSIVYFARPADDVLMQPIEKFSGKNNVKVAGKFDELYDDSTVFRAREWMQRRSLQMGS